MIEMSKKEIEIECENRPTNPILQRFATELFFKFFQSIPHCYKFKNKVVPLAFVNTFFSWFKIGKKEKYEMIKEWEKLGFCQLKRFHGVKLLQSFPAIPNKENDSYFQLKKRCKKNFGGRKK